MVTYRYIFLLKFHCDYMCYYIYILINILLKFIYMNYKTLLKLYKINTYLINDIINKL